MSKNTNNQNKYSAQKCRHKISYPAILENVRRKRFIKPTTVAIAMKQISTKSIHFF